MWQKYQAVSISMRNGWFWIEFHNLAWDPNSHARKLDFPGNRSHLIPGRGSGPPQATAGPYTHSLCGMYAYNVTVWPYFRPLRGTYSHTSVHVCDKNQNSSGEVSPLAGPIRYRLTAYHIYGMWLVLSNTWPPLPHTTTLSNLNQHRQGILSSHDIVHNPIRYPYSDCRMVNNQLLYLASDRKSLDFCWSY
jgi:hypothetical protein